MIHWIAKLDIFLMLAAFMQALGKYFKSGCKVMIWTLNRCYKNINKAL
jgi:hypothetical protein